MNFKRKKPKQQVSECRMCQWRRASGNNPVYGSGRKPSDRRRMQAAESTRTASYL